MEIQMILQIALIFISVYLAFFKSYLSEKGKSVALKEDISFVTTEVEKVKHSFNTEQAILKTELQRVLNNEISYQQEVRNAIISFHLIINEWRYTILEVGIGFYTISNVENLVLLREKLGKYFSKAGISLSKIRLLLDNSELLNLANSLYSESLAFQHWADSKFLELQQNLESQKILNDKYLMIIKDFKENISAATELYEEKEGLILNVKLFNQSFIQERNKRFKKTLEIENQFTENVKVYLKK